MQPIIKIENLSKMYRLGVIGTGTISHDLNRWWHKVRGKEDPYLKIGEANVSDNKSSSGYVWALKDINLEVMPGEVLGIIGKNGAGKSTLLKILSKVTGPTTGKISYRGRIGSLLEVGTGFHNELTGRENIYLNGAILGMNKAEIRNKLDEIVDFAGVERYIDTPVKRYSSGMKVRLGFAVAAHLEPEILVVDEVLAVGDAEFQKKAIGKMQDVSKNDGRTILFVSHNMQAVQNLCTNGILLENGSVVYENSIKGVVEKYLFKNKRSIIFDQNDKYKLNNLFIKDKSGNATTTLVTGKSYDISFEIEGEVNLSQMPTLLVHINGPFEERVLNLSSRLAGIRIPEFNKRLDVLLNIEHLMIMPGQYFISIHLLDSVGNNLASWNNIENIEFVFDTDMINISLPAQNYRGTIYAHSKWSISYK